ncbi:hypothetical protein OIU77_007707 [Salix suchowensis]|uniref:Uncharacterized protein n=1 Tax=Salix suchowensis TaxID=1278906 RepID=A0ABQ9AI24_9ROSI|nr:hypothetical protein OIU77_007707 [Salix suchowensis]KAJ6374275.1 hypothetical protein OIU78_029896 [Salix suchowensis]
MKSTVFVETHAPHQLYQGDESMEFRDNQTIGSFVIAITIAHIFVRVNSFSSLVQLICGFPSVCRAWLLPSPAIAWFKSLISSSISHCLVFPCSVSMLIVFIHCLVIVVAAIGRRNGREELGIGFGSERDMEDTELEEREACPYHNINNNNDDYDVSMDLDIALLFNPKLYVKS